MNIVVFKTLRESDASENGDAELADGIYLLVLY
jgi:hypothetical protein